VSAPKAVAVVGIGDDGCIGLTSRARNAIARSQVLAGGERQLAFFPEFEGERVTLKKGLGAALEGLAEKAGESNVCILASGDPLFFGIGSLVVSKIGSEHVEFIPAPSSMQLAFARVGVKWNDAVFLSVHGRTVEGFLTRIKQQERVGVFTDQEHSPARLATRMLEHGETGWRCWVCENLDGPDERVREFTIEELSECQDIGPLNVLILERTDPGWEAPPTVPFLPEEAFAKRMPKKGLITKREVRLLSLGFMQIRPGSVVWDIGAGSGSISIESGLLAPRGRVYAIETDPEGVEICKDNVRTHGVDNVRVIAGRAPEALTELEDPDAVFVGGSKGSLPDILRLALERLRPGGRLVVNAVTFENVGEAYATFRDLGLQPEVTLVSISRGSPLARKYLRYEALNPIHIFAVTREESP
jgi:precorrin-6Y C5,15-methyltransferase (decarboxylating)